MTTTRQATTPTSWAEVTPGTTITVRKTYNRQAYKIEVESVEQRTDGSSYRFVNGRRLRMDGTPSLRRRRGQPQRMFLVQLAEVTLGGTR